MTAETFKKQILAVIEAWEDWIVFPPDFTSGLRQRLEGATALSESKVEEMVDEVKEEKAPFTSRFKHSSFKLATTNPSADGECVDVESDGDGKLDDVDGEPVYEADGEPVDDLDGEPMDDIDGEPAIDDIDGQPLDNSDGQSVDGQPLDIDGIPVDDLDGEPME
jgi:U2-associated protein SR140